ncbi:MAG: hypothetical protein EOP34_05810 [Rickettsiales bacterium]|nr:MAG: hypothetical protein EOP34_05810 [Rickettsiales bacterium]
MRNITQNQSRRSEAPDERTQNLAYYILILLSGCFKISDRSGEPPVHHSVRGLKHYKLWPLWNEKGTSRDDIVIFV